MSPKISVIIPTYNAELFIESAIKSVLAQSCGAAIEIIVIEDGSTDQTRDIVSDMALKHPQINFVPNEREKGPSGARNTGLLRATGEYIAFLDADDLWLPNHLENGIGFLEKNDIDVVFYNFYLVEYKTKQKIGDWFSQHSFNKELKVDELEEKHYLITDNIFNALIDESFIHLQSMIVRRISTKGVFFDEKIRRSEDRDFCIKLYLNCNAKFAYKNIITGIYNRHENSLTSETIENDLAVVLDHIHIFSQYLKIYPLEDQTADRIKEKLYFECINASYLYRKLRKYKFSVLKLCHSFNYKIETYQFKEFAKICISFLLGNALQRSRGASP